MIFTHPLSPFREKLRRFYEENGSVLLPKEVVLKDRLDANSRHELLLYRSVCQILGKGCVYITSCSVLYTAP